MMKKPLYYVIIISVMSFVIGCGSVPATTAVDTSQVENTDVVNEVIEDTEETKEEETVEKDNTQTDTSDESTVPEETSENVQEEAEDSVDLEPAIKAYSDYVTDMEAGLVADLGEDTLDYLAYYLAYLDEDDIPELIICFESVEAFSYEDGAVISQFEIDLDNIYFLPKGNDIYTIGGDGEDNWVNHLYKTDEGYEGDEDYYPPEGYEDFKKLEEEIMANIEGYVYLYDLKSGKTVQEAYEAFIEAEGNLK